MSISLLIADDNKPLAQMLSELLAMDGFEVCAVARDGIETLELCERLCPDMLLLDIVMPHIDGFGVLDALRAREHRPVCVVYSAISNDALTRQALDAGAVMYLAKPMEAEVISARLRAVAAIYLKDKTAREGELKEDRDMSSMLHKLALPPHQLGYKYTVAALELLSDEPSLSAGKLYAAIAERYAVSPANVERCIRNSVETACGRCPQRVMEDFFGYTLDAERGKPTNSEFLYMLADRLKHGIG